MPSLNIIFAGTPEFALPCLKALVQSEHNVLAVYTQPDRPAGRGRQLIASPIKQYALTQHLSVQQPETLRTSEAQQVLSAYQPDLMIVVAYGLILPEAVLAIPCYGCINVHASLLPRWRGAAPIQRAILAGDQQTGITIMQMAKGLDTGDILLQSKCPIAATATGQTMHDRLATMGADSLLEYLTLLQTGKSQSQAQDDAQANYADKIVKSEAKLNWQQNAITLDRVVRAFNPWPVAYAQLNNVIVRIWRAEPLSTHHDIHPGTIVAIKQDGVEIACSEGILRVHELQFPGGKIISAKDVLNGKHLQEGQVFI